MVILTLFVILAVLLVVDIVVIGADIVVAVDKNNMVGVIVPYIVESLVVESIDIAEVLVVAENIDTAEVHAVVDTIDFAEVHVVMMEDNRVDREDKEA